MRGLVALLALLARCRSLAPRFEVRGRSRAFTVAPLRSSTVGSGFEGKAEAGTFIDIPWDEIDLPKYEVHPRDREILRKAYEELPEGDVVPDIDPTSVDDLSPDEVLSEIERHKAMLALPDREEDVSHAIKCEVTGEMVEWFDDEVVEEKLEYWEVDEKEDPRFQYRWDQDLPQDFNYRNPPNHAGGSTWSKIRDRDDWPMFDEKLRLKEEEGWTRFDYKQVQVRADLLDPNEANFTYGHIDPRVVERIQPCLKILSNSVNLLEASDGLVRFRYYGWVRDKQGFEAWAKMLMEENGYPEIREVRCEIARVRDFNGFDKSKFS